MNLLEQIRITQMLVQYLDHLADYADSATLESDVSPGAAARVVLEDGRKMLKELVAERDKPEDFVWTRIKSDLNGNPRHKTLLDYFCTREELQTMAHSINRSAYDTAVKNATERVKALGGRMNKTGPVFSTFNRPELARKAGEIVGRNYTSVE